MEKAVHCPIGSVKESTTILGHLPLKDLSVTMHLDCETLDLFLNPDGMLTAPRPYFLYKAGKLEHLFRSVKTPFAPPQVHIMIIELLEYVKRRYLPHLRYGTREKRMRTFSKKVEMVGGGLSQTDFAINGCSPEELAKGASR